MLAFSDAAKAGPVTWQARSRIDADTLIVECEPGHATEGVYALPGLLDRDYAFYGATPEKFEDEREQALCERAGLIRAVLDDREALGM